MTTFLVADKLPPANEDRSSAAIPIGAFDGWWVEESDRDFLYADDTSTTIGTDYFKICPVEEFGTAVPRLPLCRPTHLASQTRRQEIAAFDNDGLEDLFELARSVADVETFKENIRLVFPDFSFVALIKSLSDVEIELNESELVNDFQCGDTAADLISDLRRLSGLTWQRLAELLGTSRRTVHSWVAGGSASQVNLLRISRVRACLLAADRGSSAENFAALFETQESGITAYDLLRDQDFEEARRALGQKASFTGACAATEYSNREDAISTQVSDLVALEALDLSDVDQDEIDERQERRKAQVRRRG